ncbi:hypothetical protein FLAN108750_11725 [Flavobacterium antarcticum]|uniref:hypothetical protein n=1 Tax=Flavobacterium antarcticum TaxID=271155 RepID=UPI0003B401B4|nr:hypothetical protein [Flavobacterium antarcticum]
MSTPFLNFIKLFLPFALVLFGLQYFVTLQLFQSTIFYYSIWSIYVFHIIITLAAHLFLLFVHKNFPDKTGFTFMGMGVIKMMACVVFLIPMIQSDTINRIPDVAAFFIPYFMFLLFETIFAVRLINKD